MNAKPKILVVDDRDENLVAMRGLLRRHDADLLEARSGEEARELLLHNEVALALLDVQMPGMNGFELAELMRGSERTREIPLIFITAGLHETTRGFKGYDKGIDVGAVDFLVKPIDSRALGVKVGVFLQLYHQKRRLKERVTELEEALVVTNRRLHALMEAIPVGISFADDTTCHRITSNRVALGQFAVDNEDNISASALEPSAPGKQVRFLLDGKAIADAELPLQRAVAEGREIPPMELEVVMPNGRRWFTRASGAPIRDAEGRVVGGITVTVDVTETRPQRNW